MRRAAVISIVILLCIILSGLFTTAIDPEDITGKWYSAEDQTAYLFQEGLIFSGDHAVILSEMALPSGAYAYCRDSVFLFAEGIAGLETEKILYLIHNRDSSFLCENKDGIGRVYFIRYKQ